MKISELIKELENIKEERGDLNVVVYDKECSDYLVQVSVEEHYGHYNNVPPELVAFIS